MTENDNEHKAFEAFGKSTGLDMSMHPLHLLYLNSETDKHLDVFKAGYSATGNRIRELELNLGLMEISRDQLADLLKSCEKALIERDEKLEKCRQDSYRSACMLPD